MKKNTLLQSGDSFRTNESKEYKAEKEKADLIVVSKTDLAKATAIVDAVNSHGQAGLILKTFKEEKKKADFERSVSWESDGIKMRSVLDGYYERGDGSTLVIDLKTISDARPHKAYWNFLNFNYDLQAYNLHEVPWFRQVR